MIREDRFLISHAPYAVDLNSMKSKQVGKAGAYSAVVTAVWFRRKSGVLSAHIGTLWDYQDRQPADAEAFLRAHTDGRYGGDCTGRWDGTSYWGNVTLDTQAAHLSVLRPMLEGFPEVPAGFDGWWTFRGGAA